MMTMMMSRLINN